MSFYHPLGSSRFVAFIQRVNTPGLVSEEYDCRRGLHRTLSFFEIEHISSRLENREATLQEARLEGMGVSTGTICPFPFTTANVSEVPTDVSQCTVTYAESLGPSYEILRGLVMFLAVTSIFVLGRRIIRFYEFVDCRLDRLNNHPMFHMMVLAMCFYICILISHVDMFACEGVYQIEFFVVMDEICAALGVTNGVMSVNLYHRLVHAKQTRTSRSVATKVRNASTAAIWINFIGFGVLGVVHPEQFLLYEGLKSLCGGVIFVFFLVLSSYYVYYLKQILETNLPLASNRSKAEAQIRLLVGKHVRFALVVVISSIALFTNGVIVLLEPSYQWRMPIETMLEPLRVSIRVVYMVYMLLSLYMFRVPHETHSSSQHWQDPPEQPQQLQPREQSGAEHRLIVAPMKSSLSSPCSFFGGASGHKSKEGVQEPDVNGIANNNNNERNSLRLQTIVKGIAPGSHSMAVSDSQMPGDEEEEDDLREQKS